MCIRDRSRTVVFIEKQTNSGQDVFIRRGVSPSNTLPIAVRKEYLSGGQGVLLKIGLNILAHLSPIPL